MPFELLYARFPTIAKGETRSIQIGEGPGPDLPPGSYHFLEMYCDEPGCDCRRVLFMVVASQHQEPLAVITFGWEDEQFYANWLHADDPEQVTSLKGPALNFGSPQSKYAPALLELTQAVLLQDPAYVDRIKQHYEMFRRTIEQEHANEMQRKHLHKRKKRE